MILGRLMGLGMTVISEARLTHTVVSVLLILFDG